MAVNTDVYNFYLDFFLKFISYIYNEKLLVFVLQDGQWSGKIPVFPHRETNLKLYIIARLNKVNFSMHKYCCSPLEIP